MLAFIAAVLAVIGISFGASLALESYQSTVDRSFQTSGVRIDQEEAGFGHRGGHKAAEPTAKPTEKK